MVSFAIVVAKLEVPLAVITPVSVIEPEFVSIARLPPRVVVTVPKFKAIPALVREIFPVAPLVAKDTAPVNKLTWLRVMSASASVVVKLEVPPTVRTPLSVMLSLSVSIVRVPPTVEVPRFMSSFAFISDASLPAAAKVLSETAPVNIEI